QRGSHAQSHFSRHRFIRASGEQLAFPGVAGSQHAFRFGHGAPPLPKVSKRSASRRNASRARRKREATVPNGTSRRSEISCVVSPSSSNKVNVVTRSSSRRESARSSS